MKLLKLPQVLELTANSRTTHYTHIKNNLMTAPVPLGGGHSVAWPEPEIMAINQARIAGKSDDFIRNLVSSLLADRKKIDVQGAA